MAREEHRLAKESEERFSVFIDRIASVIERGKALLFDYCTGLCLDADGRKSMEPIAAKTDPKNISRQHQAIQHFISNSAWDDEAVLNEVRRYALPAITKHAPINAWIIDDTGMPKKGEHSVGVAHQYCGQLGKQANCQVAVTLSVANDHASLPIAYRLYLPEEWTISRERCRRAGVPEDVSFATKPQIALKQIRAALDAGVPRGICIADAGYGNNTAFRDQLTQWKVPYAVAVQGTTTVWSAGTAPLKPKQRSCFGRKPKNLHRDEAHQPVSVKKLAMELPKKSYRTVQWREGTKEALCSRFAAVRVRAAHGETDTQREEEWLLIDWPPDKEEPEGYWLLTLPRATTMKNLVRAVKGRWRVERDFQELKSEFGLNHFEGRGWRGFHHHAALCIATYAFLAAERAVFSPSGRIPVAESSIPRDYRRPRASRHRAKT